MKQYLDFLKHTRDNGRIKTDRTGTGTTSVFGYQMRFDLSKGFPLVTTKKLHLKAIVHELIWFLQGSTNIKYLKENGVKIWDEWADENGELGPVYGAQWRSWPDPANLVPVTLTLKERVNNGIELENKQLIAYVPRYDALNKVKDALNNPLTEEMEQDYHKELSDVGVPEQYLKYNTIDQISNALNTIKNNPDSRRIIVSAWNPAQIDKMKLPPCHALFQFYVDDMTNNERLLWLSKDQPDDKQMELRGMTGAPLKSLLDKRNVPSKRLSCQLYQRSCDEFLGLPFNIASYALLTHMFAQQAGMTVGDFIWTGGDCHLYSNHMEQVELQLSRTPKELPTLVINRKPDSLFDYKIEDFEFLNYNPDESIKAPVAV